MSIILYISSNYKGVTHHLLLAGTSPHKVNAPAGFEEQAPYTIALVKLSEGPVVKAQLTDLGDQAVEIGMPVEMVTRKIRNDGDERGLIIYGYKFRPVMAH